MRRRLWQLAAVLALMLALAGCGDMKVTFNPQELYSLPELPAKYTQLNAQINEILTAGAEYAAPVAGSNVQPVQMLDLDGVIVSQEGFGNPDTDLIMNCKKIEAEGVKTVIITDEYAGRDGRSQSLADADAAADAVVTGGNANQVVILPKLDKVIGTLDYVTKIAGASEETLREDGSLEVELQVITGATNETGFNKLSAR